MLKSKVNVEDMIKIDFCSHYAQRREEKIFCFVNTNTNVHGHLFYLLLPRIWVPRDQTEPGSLSRARKEPGNEDKWNVHIVTFLLLGIVRHFSNRYYVVAKEPACELTIDPQCRSYWRISFSEVEKALLQPASKNAEKTCYRVVKYIFEAHRRKLQPLTSYHLKTLFLRRRHDDAKRRGCSEETMGRDVARFLKELIDEVASGFLGHFFIAGQNLLSSMEECERERITENLNQILRKLVEDPRAFLDKLNVS